MSVSLAKIKKTIRLSLKGKYTRAEIDLLVYEFFEEIKRNLLRGDSVQLHGIVTLVPTMTTVRNVFCIHDKSIKKTHPRWKLRMVVSPKFRENLASSPKKSPFRKAKLPDQPLSKK